MAIYEYKFPELGEGIHEGEIVKLHMKPGDDITDDDVIMDVQNDKAIVEVPSPVDGKIIEVKVKEGQVCRVGELVATIEVAGEAGSEPTKTLEPEKTSVSDSTALPEQTGKQANTSEKPAEPAVTAEAQDKSLAPVETETVAKEKASASSGNVLATPSVRKLAREKGVKLTHISASGKNGRITREDVLASSEQGQADTPAAAQASEVKADEEAAEVATAAQTSEANAQEREERIPFKGIRKLIANAMVKSVYTAPHVTLLDEVNVSLLVAFREKMKPAAEKKGLKLTYLPFIVKALIAAARQYPALNAMIDEERNEIVYKKYYNIGIATDTENGLLVPVIVEADRKNIWSLAAAIKDLAERGREGKLASNELKGSTITITNIGSAGGMFFTPVINFPEVAILGVGRIAEKPIVHDGQVIAAHVMALSLSFDHRVIDGATAQHFLNQVKRLLADPEQFVMEV